MAEFYRYQSYDGNLYEGLTPTQLIKLKQDDEKAVQERQSNSTLGPQISAGIRELEEQRQQQPQGEPAATATQTAPLPGVAGDGAMGGMTTTAEPNYPTSNIPSFGSQGFTDEVDKAVQDQQATTTSSMNQTLQGGGVMEPVSQPWEGFTPEQQAGIEQQQATKQRQMSAPMMNLFKDIPDEVADDLIAQYRMGTLKPNAFIKQIADIKKTLYDEARARETFEFETKKRAQTGSGAYSKILLQKGTEEDRKKALAVIDSFEKAGIYMDTPEQLELDRGFAISNPLLFMEDFSKKMRGTSEGLRAKKESIPIEVEKVTELTEPKAKAAAATKIATLQAEFGKKFISDQTAKELGAYEGSYAQLETLMKGIEDPESPEGPIMQWKRINPYDWKAQGLQQLVTTTKQLVGKALEGGVLRAEDERKYEKILPKIGDTYESAVIKSEQLQNMINTAYKAMLEGLRRAGKNVSGYNPDLGQPTEPTPDTTITDEEISTEDLIDEIMAEIGTE